MPRTTLYGALENGKATINSQEKNDDLFDFTLNYTTKLMEDNTFGLMVGYSQQTYRTEADNIRKQ